MLLTLCHLFISSPTPLSSGNHLFILCICDSASVLLGLFICFVFLNSTYKWKHKVLIFFWLISLRIIPSRFIHVVQMARLHSFSFLFFYYLSNIPLLTLSIFFIHSSIDVHLGCFYILTIVNNSTMNIRVRVSFWIHVFISSDTYLRIELLDHMEVVFSVFWDNSTVFTLVALSNYNLSNSAVGCPFLHILTNISYL